MQDELKKGLLKRHKAYFSQLRQNLLNRHKAYLGG